MRALIEKLKKEVFDLKQLLGKGGVDLSASRTSIKQDEKSTEAGNDTL